MESLGDLLQNMQNPSFRQRSRNITEQVMNHPLVQEFRAAHPELDDELLRLNMSRLYQYMRDRSNCAQCPGLEHCPNDFQGHYCNLMVEEAQGRTQIVDSRTPCNLQLAREHEQQVKQRIRSFYVDERALREGYDAVEISRKDLQRVPAVSRVFTYINEVKTQGLTPRGLYLEGTFGTGKTFLAGYMLHELAKSGYNGVIVYMPDFVEDLKSMFQDGQKLKETTDMLKNCDLLVFDDIGAENLSPWVRDHVLGSILNYRMNRKPTFFTSNYSLAGLEQHLSFTSKDGEEVYKGQRLMDRIRPFVDVITVKGTNQRGS
ncbi:MULTISPECIES: primosomal protein DnaI [Paenibacillus]|uniref:primosomal protein DnaI n=1 Tax=Paenibacillus TaxID=44249 RepID=UPI00035FA434|nr:primosomal protein DnaI [Paenibacillus massiliensis]